METTKIKDPTPFEQLVANMFCLIIEHSETELAKSLVPVLEETGHLHRCARIPYREIDQLIEKEKEKEFPNSSELKILQRISEIIKETGNIDIQNFFILSLRKLYTGEITSDLFEKLSPPIFRTSKSPMERMVTNLAYITVHISEETFLAFVDIVKEYNAEMTKEAFSNAYEPYDAKTLEEENKYLEFPEEKELLLIKKLWYFGEKSQSNSFAGTLMAGLWDIYGYGRYLEIFNSI